MTSRGKRCQKIAVQADIGRARIGTVIRRIHYLSVNLDSSEPFIQAVGSYQDRTFFPNRIGIVMDPEKSFILGNGFGQFGCRLFYSFPGIPADFLRFLRRFRFFLQFQVRFFISSLRLSELIGVGDQILIELIVRRRVHQPLKGQGRHSPADYLPAVPDLTGQQKPFLRS